ncbi:MAG: ATP synthase F1 subunit epsilon [Deltaproteobacteria bacterium]|nr:ATP synthase F1 subunit epsilon [Deltaproteobacteria bacterium]
MADSSHLLDLTVATPMGVKIKTRAESVQVPGVEGELGILPDHLPLLSALKPGVMRYIEKGKDFMVAVDRGYVEVGPDRVRLLTEGFANSTQVEVAVVEKELAQAEEQLKNFPSLCEGAEYDELKRAAAWARARLAIATS